MYASDIIQRKKQQAIYTNYQAILNTQPTCTAANCTYGGCIVRYPTYEYKQDVVNGALACGCGCPPTIAPQAVEPMFSMVMSVSEPVSFFIRTLNPTDSLLVDWGDGLRSVYTTISDGVSPGFVATVTHTYAAPGDYTISALSPIEAQLYAVSAESSNTNKVKSLVLTPIAKLYINELGLINNLLTTIDLSNCVQLGVVALNQNILTVNAVNTILVDLVNNGVSNGTASLQDQTPAAPPDSGPPDGIAARNTLLAAPRNWLSVLVDTPPAPGQASAATYLSGVNGNASSTSLAIDNSNNVYVYGNYSSSSTVTIRNVSGNSQTDSAITLPSTSSDTYLYIIKYNSSGVAEWATYVSATNSDARNIYNQPGTSSIYIVGYYTSTSPQIYDQNGTGQTLSSITLPSSSSVTGFLIKFSTAGICEWATFVPSTNVSNSLNVTADESNNIYVLGSYQDISGLAIALKDVSGTSQTDSSITISTTGASRFNAYIIKYNSAGTVLWANTITGSTNVGIGLEACIINNGALYCGGNVFNVTTGSTVTLNNPTATSQTPSSYTLPPVAAGVNSYAIIVKYNLSGEVQWSTYFQNTDPNTTVTSMVADSNFNIYVLGTYQSNPGPNLFKADGTSQTITAYSLPPSTIYSIFLVSYDQSGDVLWGTYMPSDLNSKALTIDTNDVLYLTGSYVYGLSLNLQNASGFGQANSGYTVPGTVVGNAVLIAYSNTGQVQWATYLPGTSRGYGCVVTSTFDVYMAGSYTNGSAVTIYNSSGTGQSASSYTIPASASYNSAFLVKYSVA